MKKLALLLFLTTAFVSAQVKAPQPSPLAKTEQMVGLTEITIAYSRPAMRERTIFGGLVPYNKMWRTGANENTKITFSDDVKIGGKKLEKGTYAVFTKPMEDRWEVIFYKDASNWGLPKEWDKSKVAVNVEAKTDQLPFNMETFTIMLDNLSNNSATLNFIWESTVAYVSIEVPTEEKTMESIKTTLKGNPTANDYYAAANYYYEANKDMDQALEWIEKSEKMQKNGLPFYMMRKKALIQAELGMQKEAIKTAELSIEGAKKAGNTDYVKMNEASIEEWSN
ncbi:DUF2911 domain-containing protein [Mesonia aquimarina]|uniref:DUF2911 domain-containing protein n=1 Tax=Mesonia aquimarina TaxID=1504967 RepID=UPI000EF61A0F|nr:DUF2911 domain-containing protein [Mesonia aquimarina]